MKSKIKKEVLEWFDKHRNAEPDELIDKTMNETAKAIFRDLDKYGCVIHFLVLKKWKVGDGSEICTKI